MLGSSRADQLRIATFAVDASPPIGSPLAYDPTVGVESPLSIKGVVLLGSGEPIVLCAVDWIGIGNGGYDAYRQAFADAAGTTPQRVALHCLHQHDAPVCDFSVHEILAPIGIADQFSDIAFCRDVMERTAHAIQQCLDSARPVTHIGQGQGKIEKVASNRRILGEDGRVEFVRYTATVDPNIRAKPVGTIDPMVKLISFWNNEEPMAVLSYYATHPQSYYRTKLPNPDFPGMARNVRESETNVPHIHFNGAGGNIGAGKWNDGSPANRQVLADRVHAGMVAAWESTTKTPLSSADVRWQTLPVALPVKTQHSLEVTKQLITDETVPMLQRQLMATDLAWAQRSADGHQIDLSCLSLGKNRILHMPGELFVEYQLAAQAMRPDLFVAMAAYGDYAPGYIGTKIAYSQGGYETEPRSSRVSSEVEEVLMRSMRILLDVND